MKMIPPIIDLKAPYGEKEVFEILKSSNSDSFKDCIAFHSLNYPPEEKKIKKKSYNFFGESDFVIFIPNKGLINIEIKGGGVSRENGEWFTEDRKGKHKIKDPFKQANKSLFLIGDYLKKKNIFIPQDYLVIFPDCEFDINTIEIPGNNLVSGNLNSNLLKKIKFIANDHLIEMNGKFFPHKKDEKKILNLIRPNFDINTSNINLLNQSRKQIENYTKEQVKILENYDEERMIIEGSQGTGKTVIAEEIIKQNLINGSVLFISSNKLRNLETKLRFKDYDNFECYTFHNYLNKLAEKIAINLGKEKILKEYHFLDFQKKSNYLLNFISNEILNFKDLKKYDYLVLDEMQNYCHYKEFYGVFGSLINGDLKKGKWYFFGDFDYQNLWDPLAGQDKLRQNITNPKIYLNDMNPSSYKLSYNVRNAHQIALHSPFLSGITESKLPARPFIINIDGKVTNYFESTDKNKIKRLELIVENLFNQNINGSDITILSSNKISHPKNILARSNIAKYYKVIDLTQTHKFGDKIINSNIKDSIYFSTIQGFQGMENKIIILLDPLTTPIEEKKNNIVNYSYGKEVKNLLTFNAMGRANTLLFIIWDKIHEKYTNLQTGKALKKQSEIMK